MTELKVDQILTAKHPHEAHRIKITSTEVQFVWLLADGEESSDRSSKSIEDLLESFDLTSKGE